MHDLQHKDFLSHVQLTFLLMGINDELHTVMLN